MNRALPVLVFAYLLAGGSGLWGEEIVATVGKILGKAQVQRGADWVPLAVGQKLAPGDTVSTGFRSELQLKIGPSTITVKALSRLALQSLSLDGTTLKTDLYLKVGKVDAEVNKSEAVQSQKFQVSSPVATASVRGTAFTFDGLNLQVTRGLVDFSDSQGNTVSIPVGESARIALRGTKQVLATNQVLVVQESILSTSTDTSSSEEEATVSWNGWSEAELLQYLYAYDWYGDGGGTGVYLDGIEPIPFPALTYLSLGGVDALAPPWGTYISLGGINALTPPWGTYINLGGINALTPPWGTYINLGGINAVTPPWSTYINLGGINAVTPPALTTLNLGGIDAFDSVSPTHLALGGIDP